MLTGPKTNRRSNAKTAYGLMSDIRAYILEEPKRIWMKDWLIKDKYVIQEMFDTDAPACGTVGCIAGNAVVLSRSKKKLSGTIDERAMELLGGDEESLWGALFELFHRTNVNADYGTKKYAKIVADRIKSFQKRHKMRLRTVRL